MVLTHRLFLALWPDAAIVGQLAAHASGWVWPAGCAVYEPTDWHVTLHFIGAVEAGRLPEIAAGLEVPVQPFTLWLDQPLLWHHGLAVLSASRTPEPLHTLHHQLGMALRGLGVAIDARPYRPHATLARHAQAARPPCACTPVEWQAHGYVLAASVGAQDGRYRVIRRYG